MNISEVIPISEFSLQDGNLYVRSVSGHAELISNFYAEAPFPNYSEFDNPLALVERSERIPFLRELSQLVQPGRVFMEVGCGTGQLSNYLGMTTLGNVIGVDTSISSLRLASDFANRHNISRVRFIRDDIRNMFEYRKESVDYLWCSGVLHHTGETWRCFSDMLGTVKPGGLLFIGLYNRYGRVFTGMRQLLVKLFGDGPMVRKLMSHLDPVLRGLHPDSEKWRAWYRDQYIHPTESWHTADELISKMNLHGFQTVGSIPDLNLDYIRSADDPVISTATVSYSAIPRIFTQLFMPFTSLGREGGLFMVIAKKC